jgi:RimJ/RimL family protein N-acetyltransferase
MKCVAAGRHVRLTNLANKDSDRLFAWINDGDLVARSAPFRPVSRADHDTWFTTIRARDDVRIFAIRPVDDDELIGSCQLHSIDADERSAELQIRIGQADARSRGYGREAVDLLLDHAFRVLELRRVTLHVLASNAPALAVYRATGFRQQAASHEMVTIDGREEQVLRMCIDAADRPIRAHDPF